MSGDIVAPEYVALQQRLMRNPMGAPAHPSLFAMLAELFAPAEARLAATMPMKPSSLRVVASRAGLPVEQARDLLESMAGRGLVVDIPRPDGRFLYLLNPPIVGFFEFSMMRIRDDFDQGKVAALMWDYMRGDPDLAFAKEVNGIPTYLARPLAGEDVLPADHTEILDWERATEVIDRAGSWAEGMCHCRHVASRTGRACRVAPAGSCLSLGFGADYLVRHGQATAIPRERAREILAESRELGLVQMCDNVKRRPTYICNCCSCCCEMLEGIRVLKNREAVVTSGWVAEAADAACNGCNACVKACPVEAIAIVPAGATGPSPRRKGRAVVNADTCLGCGVCVRKCRTGALALKRSARRVHTPESMIEKTLLQALERGRLQNLLFDDPSRLVPRVLETVTGMLLNLPPARALLAREQVKSRFVAALASRLKS